MTNNAFKHKFFQYYVYFFSEQLVKKYIIEGKNAAAENATAWVEEPQSFLTGLTADFLLPFIHFFSLSLFTM